MHPFGGVTPFRFRNESRQGFEAGQKLATDEIAGEGKAGVIVGSRPALPIYLCAIAGKAVTARDDLNIASPSNANERDALVG